MRLTRIFIFILFLILYPLLTFTQQKDKIIILNNADSLVGKVINGEKVRELIGNVQFTQGDVIVNCDRALQNLETDQVMLYGNITIQEDTLLIFGTKGIYNSKDRTAESFEGIKVQEGTKTLSADYSKYYIEEEKIFFRGNVAVMDTNATLSCDELTYYRTDKRSIARNNVKIIDLKSNLTTYSNRFENIGSYSYLSENPFVFQVDTTSDGSIDTLRISSVEMHSYQDSVPHFISTGNVVIQRGNVTAEAGEAVYYTDLDSINLKKKPTIWYEETQVSGDSIFVKIIEQKLNKVYVRGNSFAISRSDSILKNRFDQMSGENITMNFENGDIQNIIVDITATSLYYLYEKPSSTKDTTTNLQQPNGLNISTGDRIIITFENKSIDEIKIIGGTEGKYFPENVIKGREIEYNLAGFNWRNEKPSIPDISIFATKKNLKNDGKR